MTVALVMREKHHHILIVRQNVETDTDITADNSISYIFD